MMTFKRCAELIGLVSLLLGSGAARAEDPGDSGSTATQTKSPRPAPKDKDEAGDKPRRNCFMDLASPPGGNGSFTEAGTLYLLAQTGALGKRSGGETAAKTAYMLFKVDLKGRRAERVAAFNHLPGASLLTAGNPIQSATAIAFSGKRAGCYGGPAALLDINLGQAETKAMHTVGQYEIVKTPAGELLFELKKRVIISIDPSTFQRKALRRVPDDQRPLFYDPAKKTLTTWIEDGEHRGLAQYDSKNDKPSKELAVKKGDRVLQDGGAFAIAHFNPKDNSIDLLPAAGWSGDQKPGRFPLVLPPTYPVASAGLEVDFKNHLALVFGANFAAKQRWQRVFVFDYSSGQLLGGVPVTGTQYLHYAGIDPGGSYAFFEVRDSSTRRTLGAKVFDMAKKSFDDVSMDLGTGESKAAAAADAED